MLELALECDEYQALPYFGGVMDQPAGLMRKMRQLKNVYTAFKEYEREGKIPGESASWKRNHSQLWEIVSQVNELRKKYG